MVKSKYFLVVLACLFASLAFSQETDIAAMYGRFWSPYQYKDYGSAYRNNNSSNYNFFPSISINKYYSAKFSAELGVFFTLYEQYYGTRKYSLAFESSYGAGHIVLRAGYSFFRTAKFEARVKGGIGLGIAPDMFEGEYVEMFVFPFVDSISRGTIKRNFTPVFPMLSTGVDFSYKLSDRLKLSLAANYQKGFLKITEYDIWYNDGSGNNDQHARQWGKGTFYGIQLGLRYVLRNRDGQKPIEKH